MNEQVLLWAIGSLVAIATPVIAWIAHVLWTHVIECKHVTARLASLEGDMNRTKQDIGTHDTGMRAELHHLAGECSRYELRISLMEKENELEKRISALEFGRK